MGNLKNYNKKIDNNNDELIKQFIAAINEIKVNETRKESEKDKSFWRTFKDKWKEHLITFIITTVLFSGIFGTLFTHLKSKWNKVSNAAKKTEELWEIMKKAKLIDKINNFDDVNKKFVRKIILAKLLTLENKSYEQIIYNLRIKNIISLKEMRLLLKYNNEYKSKLMEILWRRKN